MASLQIFMDKTPIYTKDSIAFKVGFFADDYSLTNVTDKCRFEISFGKENVLHTKNNKFLAIKAGNVGIKAFYATSSLNESDVLNLSEYIATTSLVIIDEAILPNKDDIYACIKQEEPESVYTQAADINSFTYLDNQGVSDVFASLYKNLEQETSQVYPELATDYPDWVNTLFNGIYINSKQGQINKALQLLRNLQILASMNPFDIVKVITSYIYFRTGVALYVYVFEHKINFNQSWILGTNNHSILGQNTYLTDSNEINTVLQIYVFDTNHQLSDLFKIELESFINKIIRVYFGYTIDYSKTPQDFGLTYYIGMTYKGDQRNIYSYCLQYNKAAFYNVVGLINPLTPAYIQDMAVTPSNGSNIIVPSKLIIIGTFIGGFTANITDQVNITKSNNNLKILVDVLIPQQPGTCTLTITYGNLTRIIEYQVF